jgi:hypothetical protein
MRTVAGATADRRCEATGAAAWAGAAVTSNDDANATDATDEAATQRSADRALSFIVVTRTSNSRLVDSRQDSQLPQAIA